MMMLIGSIITLFLTITLVVFIIMGVREDKNK